MAGLLGILGKQLLSCEEIRWKFTVDCYGNTRHATYFFSSESDAIEVHYVRVFDMLC